MKSNRFKQHRTRGPQVRINADIIAESIRLINYDGQQLGVVTVSVALEKAAEGNLDLVEIAPKADPPVCKIMDFGKYKYEIAKKAKDSKKKQHTINVKEVRMRPKIERHDLDTKIKKARKFIDQGDRVKVSVMFRGREMTRIEFGKKLLIEFGESMGDIARIENPLTREGNTLVMVFSKK